LLLRRPLRHHQASRAAARARGHLRGLLHGLLLALSHLELGQGHAFTGEDVFVLARERLLSRVVGLRLGEVCLVCLASERRLLLRFEALSQLASVRGVEAVGVAKRFWAWHVGHWHGAKPAYLPKHSSWACASVHASRDADGRKACSSASDGLTNANRFLQKALILRRLFIAKKLLLCASVGVS